MKQQAKSCSLLSMIMYSIGDFACSLIDNSISGFAMLYYTDVLGLKPSLAGIAMSLAIFWNAFTTPIMGHISDNTRSRFGRRHSYVLFGGLAMIAAFIFIWFVPSTIKTNMQALFIYLLIMNLILRTMSAVFNVPFTALGYELCTDYEGRVKLQSVRSVMNMVANFCGPTLAWTIFFSNNNTVRATGVEVNYLRMSGSFASAAALSILTVVIATRKHIEDSRHINIEGNNIRGFIKNMKEIISDFYPRYVFACIAVYTLGAAISSSLQMYLYEHYMKFSGIEKTFSHGSTMLGVCIGSILAAYITKKLDKKGTVYFGVILSVACNFILAGLFLPGILKPGQIISFGAINIPLATIVFIFFHCLSWLGGGIMGPIIC
jgi:GPH family glycoside/pentoside/hexuronide:cation symporter